MTVYEALDVLVDNTLSVEEFSPGVFSVVIGDEVVGPPVSSMCADAVVYWLRAVRDEHEDEVP